MPVSTLSATIGSLLPTGYSKTLNVNDASEHLGGFADIFRDTLANAAITDTRDKVSEVDLLTGLSDDFSGLLLDAEKADIALSLTVQIRNKILDAYSEIMRMQV
ncbi:MAG: flagellar hook-basal body complex protein FliE [Oscillospiraceae bacterium]|jgi:flagellar hook-basal body complex protein FliE|nr:flagellar hook-basal body complex protein FliE [Oscillospiraceae bacterium]